jgi:hypothetical protein
LKLNNPNVLKNLTPFKKGEDQRRNLAGRPHKLPDLKEILANVLGKDKNGITAAEEIIEAMRKKAAKGDVRAAEMVMNRGWGTPKATLDITTNGQNINNSINIFPPGTEETFEIKEGE